jgi:hypothetical protein
VEKLRNDCLESEGVEPAGLEERIAAQAMREAVRAKPVGDEGRYEDVGEYDPVLRSHCRLDL